MLLLTILTTSNIVLRDSSSCCWHVLSSLVYFNISCWSNNIINALFISFYHPFFNITSLFTGGKFTSPSFLGNISTRHLSSVRLPIFLHKEPWSVARLVPISLHLWAVKWFQVSNSWINQGELLLPSIRIMNIIQKINTTKLIMN